MKTKIKAAIVLNAHESAVIATVLAQLPRIKSEPVTAADKETQRVVKCFLEKRSQLEHVLSHVSEGPF